jgi:hypothetical protein
LIGRIHGRRWLGQLRVVFRIVLRGFVDTHIAIA